MPQATQSQISALFDMTPTAALRWLKNKGLRVVGDASSMSADEHASSFGFANLSRLDVAQDIVDGLTNALADGKTQQQFIKDLTPLLQQKGWWGTREEIDTDTGEVKTVRQGSPGRLATIYRTNIFSAYAAGNYEAMRANAANRPYWRYTAVMDKVTRPSHAALHNMVFRFDDPIWKILFPPNGYNCRCRVEAMTEAEVKARGYTIYSSTRIVTQSIKTPGQQTDGQTVRGVEFSDGTTTQTFFPDAGFDTNPALAVYQTNPDKYALELARPYTAEALRGPQMAELYDADGTGETLPAAVLDEATQTLWDVAARTVWLTEPAITAQRVAGTLPALARMADIQSLIESPALAVRAGGQIVTFGKIGAQWYRVSVDPVTLGVKDYTAVDASVVDDARQSEEILSDSEA